MPRSSFGRRVALTLASVLALSLSASAPARAGTGDPTNPFAGKQQFIDCEAGHTSVAPLYSAWWQYYHAPAWEKPLIAKIAKVPQVKWFAGLKDTHTMSRLVERYLANVDHPQWGGPECRTRLHYSGETWRSGPVLFRDPYVGSYPVIALRGFKYDKCRGWDGGPWNSVARNAPYKRWIDAFVRQFTRTYSASQPYEYWNAAPPPWARWRSFRERGAAIVLEPDGLGMIGRRTHCLSRKGRLHRYALLRYAVNKLRALPNVAVYIDAGAGDWLYPDEAVRMLRLSGIGRARGFAFNATHFDATRNELRAGNKVAKKLHRHFIVNTAENGRGALPKRLWGKLGANAATCNPINAGLGLQPTTRTGSRYADAFVWLGRPGISSNAHNRCGRGPTTPTWFPAQALQLAQRAVFSAPVWPPRPFDR